MKTHLKKHMHRNGQISLTLVILKIYVFCLCRGAGLPSGQLAEESLITSLLSSYNADVRPSDQVAIDISVSLQQIVSLEEKQQIMTSSSFISQKWTDERLSWTPNSTNNFIRVVMLSASDLWTPDIMILNSADSDGYLSISDQSLASVNYRGQVFLSLPVLAVQTRCRLYLRKFPFDEQTCTINLTSWGQGANRVFLTKANNTIVDTSLYSEHPIWTLNKANIVEIRYEGDRLPFESTYNTLVTVELDLKRKPLFFMMNGIVACLILNFVTLLSYALPFGSQVGLCMTCFLTYSVYSLNFSNLFPQQSDYLMMITLYFLMSMFWTLLSMIWFVICNHYTTRGHIPKKLNDFCAFLQRVFFCCFTTPGDTACVKCATCPDPLFRRKRQVQSSETNELQSVSSSELGTIDGARTTASCVSINVNEPVGEAKAKCQQCDRCQSCQNEFQDDKTKHKNKKDVESKCSALNYLIFSLIFLFMFVGNVALWTSMAN